MEVGVGERVVRYERLRRLSNHAPFILQVMNEAGLRVENTLHELEARADPGAWARIEGYLKPGMLTGDQRTWSFWSRSIPVLLALHYGGRRGSACNFVACFPPRA